MFIFVSDDSFDIFDTLITRKTATPRGIFALLSEKINDSSIQGPKLISLDLSNMKCNLL